MKLKVISGRQTYTSQNAVGTMRLHNHTCNQFLFEVKSNYWVRSCYLLRKEVRLAQSLRAAARLDMSPRRSNEERAKWRGKYRKVLSKHIGKTRRRSQVSSYQCRLYNSRLLSPRLADADYDIAPWFTVCNYSPAGNVEGEYVMNVVEHQRLPHSFSPSNTPEVVGRKKVHLPMLP